MAKDTMLKKRSRISEYFVWHDSQSTFPEVLKTIFDCNFKKQLHFLICPNKRVSLAIYPAFFLTATSFNYFLANFQVPNEDSLRETTLEAKERINCSRIEYSIFLKEKAYPNVGN